MARASSTFALAVLLGVGTYVGIKADGLTGEMLSVAILVLSIGAAAAIGRWYVLASLVGPFLALVVLESQGCIGSDGVQPLGFVMLLTNLFWTALALLVGLGAHRVFNSRREGVSGADRG
jgi:hypothetical protein